MSRRELINLLSISGALGLLGFTKQNSFDVFNSVNYKPDNQYKDETSKKNFPAMKTIGILGGFGAQATMDLEVHIHFASRQLIPPSLNSGYPPLIVYYYRHPPVLLKEDFSPVFPLQPDPRLLEAAGRLGEVADFILISSNGVHVLQQQIEKAAGRKILSMIDVTLEEVKKKNWKRVGVLGYKTPMVYTSRLKEIGIAFETIDRNLQEKLDASVMKVMEGSDDMSDHKIAMQAILELRKKYVDGIIPGCTEIPLLLKENANDADLVNPAKLLAEAAVKFSLS